MYARCDKCENGFESHDGGCIIDGVTYCPKCEQKYLHEDENGDIIKSES